MGQNNQIQGRYKNFFDGNHAFTQLNIIIKYGVQAVMGFKILRTGSLLYRTH